MDFDFTRFEFRNVTDKDALEVAEIERLCFPPNEACKEEDMIRRVNAVKETFLVAFDRVNSSIAGFLCGIASSEEAFRDEFFTDPSLHDNAGKNVFLLGLDVRPEYRHRGLASEIMDRYIDREYERGCEKIILTCHEELVPFYQGFGFTDLGIGNSKWGGVSWHDMELIL